MAYSVHTFILQAGSGQTPTTPSGCKAESAHAKKSLTRSQRIQRAAHAACSFFHHMSVNHRRAHVIMSQQFLHRAYVLAGFEQVGSERMAQGMAGGAFGPAELADGGGHRAGQGSLV